MFSNLHFPKHHTEFSRKTPRELFRSSPLLFEFKLYDVEKKKTRGGRLSGVGKLSSKSMGFGKTAEIQQERTTTLQVKTNSRLRPPNTRSHTMKKTVYIVNIKVSCFMIPISAQNLTVATIDWKMSFVLCMLEGIYF